MNNLNFFKPKRIDGAIPQNMMCRYSAELGYVYKYNFTLHDLYQLLEKLKPTESIDGCRDVE